MKKIAFEFAKSMLLNPAYMMVLRAISQQEKRPVSELLIEDAFETAKIFLQEAKKTKRE